jgi:hypothetical protein
LRRDDFIRREWIAVDARMTVSLNCVDEDRLGVASGTDKRPTIGHHFNVDATIRAM